MKSQNKKRLNYAIWLLRTGKNGCPDEFGSKIQDDLYCDSLSCKKCWLDFINFKLKEAKEKNDNIN